MLMWLSLTGQRQYSPRLRKRGFEPYFTPLGWIQTWRKLQSPRLSSLREASLPSSQLLTEQSISLTVGCSPRAEYPPYAIMGVSVHCASHSNDQEQALRLQVSERVSQLSSFPSSGTNCACVSFEQDTDGLVAYGEARCMPLLPALTPFPHRV